MAVSILLALVVSFAALVAGYQSVGLAIAIGLVVGALNGFMIQRVLDRRAPILATAILRLAILSFVALAAAALTGWSIGPLVAGIAIAQLVMVGVGAREGLRS